MHTQKPRVSVEKEGYGREKVIEDHPEVITPSILGNPNIAESSTTALGLP
jgi:hypothetical protein